MCVCVCACVCVCVYLCEYAYIYTQSLAHTLKHSQHRRPLPPPFHTHTSFTHTQVEMLRKLQTAEAAKYVLANNVRGMLAASSGLLLFSKGKFCLLRNAIKTKE